MLPGLPGQRHDGLQVVIQPGTLVPLTMPILHIGKITALDALYVEFLRMRGIAPEGIPAGTQRGAAWEGCV
jgi:hypothetical protein